jgi:diaminopimelate epimerase
MKLTFTKMHGLGNDFVVIDSTSERISLTSKQLQFIANRRVGVGCDQILLVERARDDATDFYYRIFNADGHEVEQCGNGARCFLKYVRRRGLTNKSEIRVGTIAGVIVPKLEADGQVTVDMGVPLFEPRDIPFIADARNLTYRLDLAGVNVEISALSMGNPHAVQIVSDVKAAPVAVEGPQIEAHERFPRRVNAGYMQVIDRRRIRLRVYERGAGETLACGTGACAAVVAGITRDVLDPDCVTVETLGGNLQISWAGENRPVVMTGPAVAVFDGELAV